MRMIAILCVCSGVCVCDGDEKGGGCVVREREREKWKAPVIKSLKECERGAHRSKQTLSLDSSLFIYAPRLKPPHPSSLSLSLFTCLPLLNE